LNVIVALIRGDECRVDADVPAGPDEVRLHAKQVVENASAGRIGQAVHVIFVACDDVVVHEDAVDWSE
jgi:hypothetical protein